LLPSSILLLAASSVNNANPAPSFHLIPYHPLDDQRVQQGTDAKNFDYREGWSTAEMMAVRSCEVPVRSVRECTHNAELLDEIVPL
jgi:hypothetical protein